MEIPRNEDPTFLNDGVEFVTSTVQTYGWFMLAGVVIALYLYFSKIRPKIDQWSQKMQESADKKMDGAVAHSRLEAMELARARMQEQFDNQVKLYEEKQKEKEETQRQEKIEDWERHQEGKGYRNKMKPASELPSSSRMQSQPKPKKALKPDYNPLMGDGAGVCYRPTRRGGGG